MQDTQGSAAPAGSDAEAAAMRRGQLVPVRWRIFGFLFGIGFLAYLQQRSLTVAAARIIPELHISQMQIGFLEQAFVIGYALFQIPGGVFGQRWGARWTFLGIGCLSLLAVTLTAMAPLALTGASLFVMLIAAQFLLGVSQAPIFPVSTGVFESWFQPQRWALVQGLQTMGLSLGAALAPPFIAALMITIGWQKALLWTAAPAIPLYLWWAWYGRNSPREHASVSQRELDLLQDTGAEQANARLSLRELLEILRDRNVLLLALSYLAMNYVFYLLANWCFLYLIQQRGFSMLEGGWLAVAPPIAAGIGAGLGGVIASALFVRLGSRRGLRLTPLLALPAAGVLLIVAVHAANAYVAVAVLALCYGLVELTEGSYWAAAMTIGRSNTMAVGGVLNTGGNLGGVIGIPVVAYLSGHGSWTAAFLIGTGFALLSAVAWLGIDASRCVGSTLPVAHHE
jgi:ACS family glucarate transporter-like MFS transporter